jgi:hypothetical protein
VSERRKAPESVMRDLCEAVLDLAPCALPAHLDHYVKAYRAATAPLRTRASVDAELTAWIRDSVATKRHINNVWDTVLRLCSEPIADDHGSSSTPAAKESRDNAGVSAGPAKCDCGAYSFQPHNVNCAVLGRGSPLVDRVLASDEPELEKCGCEETEALRDEVNELRQLLDYARRTAQDIVTVLEEARK